MCVIVVLWWGIFHSPHTHLYFGISSRLKSARFKMVFYTKCIWILCCQRFILSVVCIRELSHLRAVVGNSRLSFFHTHPFCLSQCLSLSSANSLSLSFFSHLVAFSLWSHLTHWVWADKHLVISIRPPRCWKVSLKCKCVYVHVRNFVLSVCASVFVTIQHISKLLMEVFFHLQSEIVLSHNLYVLSWRRNAVFPAFFAYCTVLPKAVAVQLTLCHYNSDCKTSFGNNRDESEKSWQPALFP